MSTTFKLQLTPGQRFVAQQLIDAARPANVGQARLYLSLRELVGDDALDQLEPAARDALAQFEDKVDIELPTHNHITGLREILAGGLAAKLLTTQQAGVVVKIDEECERVLRE